MDKSQFTTYRPNEGNSTKSEIQYIAFNIAKFTEICSCSPLNNVSNMELSTVLLRHQR